MVWDLKDHPVPTSCHGQGHLSVDQTAPSPVQPGLKVRLSSQVPFYHHYLPDGTLRAPYIYLFIHLNMTCLTSSSEK